MWQSSCPINIITRNRHQITNVNYGSAPDNYQKILKDYLIKNLNNYKSAKVEFINEPVKLTIDHLEISTEDTEYASLSINKGASITSVIKTIFS